MCLTSYEISKLKNVTIAPLRDSGFFSNGNVEIKALSKDYLGQGM